MVNTVEWFPIVIYLYIYLIVPYNFVMLHQNTFHLPITDYFTNSHHNLLFLILMEINKAFQHLFTISIF